MTDHERLINPNEPAVHNHWDFSRITLLTFLLLLFVGSVTILFLLFYNPGLIISSTSLTLEALTTASLVASCVFIMLIASMISKNRTTLVGWLFTIVSVAGWILGLSYPELFSAFAKYAQISAYVFFTATTIFQKKEWAAMIALLISIAAIATLCLTLYNPALLGFLECPPEIIVVKSLLVAIAGCVITFGIVGFESINNKMREWKQFYREHKIAATIVKIAIWGLIILLLCLPIALWLNDWHLTHWTKLDVDLDSATILSKFTLGMQFVMLSGFLAFWWVKNTLNEATEGVQNEQQLANAPQPSQDNSRDPLLHVHQNHVDAGNQFPSPPGTVTTSASSSAITSSEDEDEDEEDEEKKSDAPPSVVTASSNSTLSSTASASVNSASSSLNASSTDDSKKNSKA